MLSLESVLVSEEVKYDHNHPKRWFEEEYILGYAKPRLEGTV